MVLALWVELLWWNVKYLIIWELWTQWWAKVQLPPMIITKPTESYNAFLELTCNNVCWMGKMWVLIQSRARNTDDQLRRPLLRFGVLFCISEKVQTRPFLDLSSVAMDSCSLKRGNFPLTISRPSFTKLDKSDPAGLGAPILRSSSVPVAQSLQGSTVLVLTPTTCRNDAKPC